MNDLQEYCERILEEAKQQNVILRVLGGMAVHLHAPQASEIPVLKRTYGDLDFVTTLHDSQRMRAFFSSIDFTPNSRFNALRGKRRMIFYSPDQSWYIDIFVDEFRMCHNLKFPQKRLELEPKTVPLAELFLTKLQIIEVNEKDVKDIAAMLLEHPWGEDDRETINIKRILDVCSRDWGFYNTVRKNIDRIPKFVENFALPADQNELILSRLSGIADEMDHAPKSIDWKMRAVVGEKVRWYEEPEDATRDAISLKLE
jgi:hypothetical protein